LDLQISKDNRIHLQAWQRLGHCKSFQRDANFAHQNVRRNVARTILKTGLLAPEQRAAILLAVNSPPAIYRFLFMVRVR
jgi:hypothetical protein